MQESPPSGVLPCGSGCMHVPSQPSSRSAHTKGLFQPAGRPKSEDADPASMGDDESYVVRRQPSEDKEGLLPVDETMIATSPNLHRASPSCSSHASPAADPLQREQAREQQRESIPRPASAESMQSVVSGCPVLWRPCVRLMRSPGRRARAATRSFSDYWERCDAHAGWMEPDPGSISGSCTCRDLYRALLCCCPASGLPAPPRVLLRAGCLHHRLWATTAPACSTTWSSSPRTTAS